MLFVAPINGTRSAYVDRVPVLILGGCNGGDERQVFDELCRIVDDAIALYQAEGKPLPPATAGRDLANTLDRVA